MAVPYTTVEEFSQRLAETVILYGNEPIYVAQVGSGNSKRVRLTCWTLPLDENGRNATAMTLYGDDPAINAHDIKLGYINTESWGPLYVTRMPSRQGKQGLCNGNTYVPPNVGRNWVHLIYHKGCPEMLKGQYPTYKETVDKVVSIRVLPRLQAFGRRFALEYDELQTFKLHYRGKPIATGYEPDRMRLPDHLKHLKEVLHEQGIIAA